jgi:signal transduction histidine kinase
MLAAYARVRRHAALTAVVGAAVGGTAILATWSVAPYPLPVWLTVQLAGLSFVVCGAVLWWRRPANGTGRLMALVGITWYLGDLQLSGRPALFAVGWCLYYLSTAVLGHLVLALPNGRLHSRAERLVVALSYLAQLVEIPRYAVEYPPEPQGWPDPTVPRSVLAPIGSGIALALTLATVVLVIRHWTRAGRLVRRQYALVWLTIVGIGVVNVVHPVAAALRAPSAVPEYLLLAHGVGLIVIPVALAIGLLRVRLVRMRVADLVVELGRAAEPERVRQALARALDDPGLEVWYPPPDVYHAVDGRATTVVARRGEPLAVLVHDLSLDDHPQVVDAVVAAVGLALDSSHLQARLMVAGEAERRRIQRDLHDGVQHKLLAVGMLVDRVQQDVSHPHLAAAAVHLRDSIAELRALAEGIHPPVLAEQGLAAAVEVLAERAPLPVTVDIPDRRWAETVERAAYFVVAESLANVYKHAGASRVDVRVATDAGTVVVEVTDDGTGGADPARGTGLSGLHDRVCAVGGRLRLHSRPGTGTRLVAELPCES